MAGFARRELDLLGFARRQRGRRAAVRRPRRASSSAATCSSSRTSDEARTTRASAGSCASTTRARPRSRRTSSSPAARPMPAELEAFLAERRAARSTCACPSAARRRLMALAGRNAAETLAARAGPLARRPGPDAWRAGGAGQRARAGGPADAHRVLRHQHHPGHQLGRQHGRVRGGPAARATTAGSGSRRWRARRLRQPPGGLPAPLQAGPRARRGAPKSSAGGCPTWSSSTAARAR